MTSQLRCLDNAVRVDANPASKYEHQQVEEIEVLKCIYGDEFIEHQAIRSAWKKSEPRFDIHIKTDDEDVAVTLAVVITATYPRSPPLLSLKYSSGLPESIRFRLEKYLETTPLAYARKGEVMINSLVEEIREILVEMVDAKREGRELPSLEEERAAHAALLARRARERKEEEERVQLEKEKEQSRLLGEQIQIQMQKQADRAKKTPRHGSSVLVPIIPPVDLDDVDPNCTKFDQAFMVHDRYGKEAYAWLVTHKRKVARGPVAILYTVRVELESNHDCDRYALKEIEISSGRGENNDPIALRERVQAVEAELQNIRNLWTRNPPPPATLLELTAFRISQEASSPKAPRDFVSWKVNILTPYAEKGSLEELLEVAGELPVTKVRAWTAALLGALEFLHVHGCIHRDIHARNVLLFKDSSGSIIPKLSDVSFERKLLAICTKQEAVSSLTSAGSAYWLPPETAAATTPEHTSKTDIWELGVVVMQMAFGPDVTNKHNSPRDLIRDLSLSRPFKELASKFFSNEARQRPRAFELSSTEFLATDAPLLQEQLFAPSTATGFGHPFASYLAGRRNSRNPGPVVSRYLEDYIEEATLGRGAFGQVVRARKKLDGQLYAIKKINQDSGASLTEILKEVRLLSQLSHPAIVRYYNTWLEETADPEVDEEVDDKSTEGDDETESDSVSAKPEPIGDGTSNPFMSSAGGLDYISSGARDIEFGYSSSDEDGQGDVEQNNTAEFGNDADEDEDESHGSSHVGDNEDCVSGADNSRASQVNLPGQFKTTMYISMEYCEERTLRDLITKGFQGNTSEMWRLFRQVLEGLAHIHNRNIVHRDLKPENIFISLGHDNIHHVKIGDFGLATSGQFSLEKSMTASGVLGSGDMTRSIGTSFYMAPEIKSSANGTYTAKVDMYSLGVIFFEMNYLLVSRMERVVVLEKLRQSVPQFPSDFDPPDSVIQDITLALVAHDPKNRPSSIELLKSGKVPAEMEGDTIRRALAALGDPALPYYPKVLETLFTIPIEPSLDYAWDLQGPQPDVSYLVERDAIKRSLGYIFRRHGAVELPRATLYPHSAHYGANAVELMDREGTILQLPYDHVLGHARMLSKQTGSTLISKSFSFGVVYRNSARGAQPNMFGELDFDIVSADTADLALKDAEVIKVLDEILALPALASHEMCIHIGHSNLLHLIYDLCGVQASARHQVSEVLSMLNVHPNTWSKIRSQLRSPDLQVSATSVDELRKFDWRDIPPRAFTKLKRAFEGTHHASKLNSALAHLKEVVEFCKLMGVTTKTYITPLTAIHENLYRGGIMFSCHYEKGRSVFAAGGRFDSLIREFKPKAEGLGLGERHAVGFNFAWENLARTAARHVKRSNALRKQDEDAGDVRECRRCEVLVASFDPTILRTQGVSILALLWSNAISAELSADVRSTEDLLSKHRDDTYSWIVILKQDNLVKIKSMGRKDIADLDMQGTQLVAWLKNEMRERDNRSGGRSRLGVHPILHAGVDSGSHGSASAAAAAAAAAAGGGGGSASSGRDREQEVHVLTMQTKSKKFNRKAIVEAAQVAAVNEVQNILRGPILAIELGDAMLLELIRTTSLDDPESWRRVERDVQSSDRYYIRNIHDILTKWRAEWSQFNINPLHHHHLLQREERTARHAFIYNFRNRSIIYYDLGPG